MNVALSHLHIWLLLDMLQKLGASSIYLSAWPSYLILISVSRTLKCWKRFSLHLQTQDFTFNVVSVVPLMSLSSAEL